MIPIGKTFASDPIGASERYNGKWVYMHNVTTFSDAQFTCDVMLCGAVRARARARLFSRRIVPIEIQYRTIIAVDGRTFSTGKIWGLRRRGWRCVPIMKGTRISLPPYHRYVIPIFENNRRRRHDFPLSPRSSFRLAPSILDNQVVEPVGFHPTRWARGVVAPYRFSDTRLPP